MLNVLSSHTVRLHPGKAAPIAAFSNFHLANPFDRVMAIMREVGGGDGWCKNRAILCIL